MSKQAREMAEIPERIWVQWYGDDEFADEPLDATVDEAVTWCVDKINEHDVQYVKVDALDEALGLMEAPFNLTCPTPRQAAKWEVKVRAFLAKQRRTPTYKVG